MRWNCRSGPTLDRALKGWTRKAETGGLPYSASLTEYPLSASENCGGVLAKWLFAAIIRVAFPDPLKSEVSSHPGRPGGT
jgi:hypothetical protein